MSGKVVHFEIPYDDGDRASGFYREAFGWDLQTWTGGDYTLVSTGPSAESGPTEPGFINGGMMHREGFFGTPVITIAVDDMDQALAAVERLGGKTIQGKEAVGDMGFSAYFQDTEGNLLGLFQQA